MNRSSLRLFGLDLAALPGFFRDGWSEALQWPALRWLTPSEPIRVIHADGGESVRQGVSPQAIAASGSVRFVAIELAEDTLLRRALALPRLSDDEVRQAVELDVRAASPFAEDDLAWGMLTERNDRVHVEVALTSRRLIDRQIDQHRQRIGAGAPEVWASGARPIVFTGYGEGQRQARSRRLRLALIVLLGAAVTLLAALAITPTLQLRERAIEATRKHDELVRAVKPQANMRDEIVKLGEQARLLGKAAQQRPDAVSLLDQLTRLLADDVVISRFEISGGTIRLSGQADNAAQLLQTLGANPAFRDVRAPAGIVSAATGGKEGFTIEFSLAAEARPS